MNLNLFSLAFWALAIYGAYSLAEWLWLAGQSLLIRWEERRERPRSGHYTLPRDPNVRVVRSPFDWERA